MKRTIPLAALLLLASCATPAVERADGPRLAITIDDLPVHGPIPAGMTANQVNHLVIAALRDAKVPVTAFINAQWAQSQPETMAVLREWRAAGIPLANHTWSHLNLDMIPTAEYEREIVLDEPVLRDLGGGSDWHWFRYPFLAEGEDATKRAEIRAFLADRGYRIASVSMDFSDWQWTAPFARCKATRNPTAIALMEQLYLDAARANVGFSRSIGQAIYGRDIPHVLLLHVGAFTARMLPRLLALYRAEGVRFVSLADAQADPAFAEDMDPRLPARPQYIAARAAAKGLPVPPQPDYATTLAALCRAAPSL